MRPETEAKLTVILRERSARRTLVGLDGFVAQALLRHAPKGEAATWIGAGALWAPRGGLSGAICLATAFRELMYTSPTTATLVYTLISFPPPCQNRPRPCHASSLYPEPRPAHFGMLSSECRTTQRRSGVQTKFPGAVSHDILCVQQAWQDQ